MKKLIALVCMLCLIGCSEHNADNSKQQTEAADTTYKVVIADNYPIENALKNTYQAGEQVTIKLCTITEHYYVVYVNGEKQAMDMDASDLTFTYFTFPMPNEDVLIEIEDVFVDIPDGPQQ